MVEPRGPRTEPKKDWVLTQGAFRRLLEWLDEGEDSGGQRYLEIRRRLALYFDRKNCLAPDELADETLNRVARRLEEEGTITSVAPAHYCYIVARFVFLEYLRKPAIEELLPEGGARFGAIGAADGDDRQDEREKERWRECLTRCVQRLKPDHRELIVGYYSGEQRVKINNRRALAARLGITMNALSIRACRIRDKLEACVRKCVEN